MMVSPSTSLTLADLTPGNAAVIVHLDNQGLNRRRLMDLGFVPGTQVEVAMHSPLGDPSAYRVRGALVALRRDQAALIHVQPLLPEVDQ